MHSTSHQDHHRQPDRRFNLIWLATKLMGTDVAEPNGKRDVPISTASMAAQDSQIDGAAHAASKRGVVRMTLPIASDLARSGFRNRTIAQRVKPLANPALIDSLVPEIIRWQTPLAYMRRTALQDAELAGKQIKKRDKLAMWYLSGNRDDAAIDQPDQCIDRARPRQHLSFGFAIHRCVGNRLAELQLKILREALLKRFAVIEVMGEPTRVRSAFLRGFSKLPVLLPG